MGVIMTDESFKYTQHNPDGSKEVRVGNLKDLHIFLSDRIDLEVYKLHKRIDKLNQPFYSSTWFPILALIFSITALLVKKG